MDSEAVRVALSVRTHEASEREGLLGEIYYSIWWAIAGHKTPLVEIEAALATAMRELDEWATEAE